MSITSEQKTITPKLRFKGFDDNWSEKHLDELLEFKNGINASKEQYGRGIKFINVLDILNNEYITYDSIIGSVDVDDNVASKYPVNYGDILFQRSSETREEVGTACVYLDRKKTAVFGGFVIRGRKIGEYDPIFLNKLLKTDISRSAITSKSGGSTRYNVGQETLSSIVLNFPTLPEQQKIASFLSTIDEKIQQLTHKKELLEQYKKGVMQQLFSGKLRFKDENGKAFPKWEEKRLGELGDIVTGKTPSTTDLDLWNGEIQFVTPTDINNNKYQFSTQRTIKEVNSTRLLPAKSIMFTCIASIGKMSLSIKPCITNQQINSVVPYEGFDNEFVYYSLLKISEYIKSTQSTTTMPIINKTEFSKFKINVPSEFEEQKMIANYLSRIDNKIEIVNKQITQNQTFNKGLLQQMFV